MLLLSCVCLLTGRNDTTVGVSSRFGAVCTCAALVAGRVVVWAVARPGGVRRSRKTRRYTLSIDRYSLTMAEHVFIW